MLESQRETLKSRTLDSIKSGEYVTGIVKNITDYGVFVDLGGLDGLLHITDMSWRRVRHPSEMLSLGDEIQVRVLKYDDKNERVSLGLKQLQPDPWAGVLERFPIGTKLSGEVVSLADYGAFVVLSEGVEGLIHVSEMSWVKRVRHPSDCVSVGDKVEVIVLDVDTNNRRISLGMKQLETNPWVELKENYPEGTVIEGEIKSITEFGVFVEIENGIDGLAHISDFSWTKKPKRPSDVYKKSDRVRAVVLSVDIENERFSLGFKQLQPDPWATMDEKFAIGTQHDVKIVKLTNFGVFVELLPEIEGLIHISELAKEKVEKPSDVFKVGDIVRAEVITMDKDAHKVALSVRLAQIRNTKKRATGDAEYKESASNTSLGSQLEAQLKQQAEEGQVAISASKSQKSVVTAAASALAASESLSDKETSTPKADAKVEMAKAAQEKISDVKTEEVESEGADEDSRVED